MERRKYIAILISGIIQAILFGTLLIAALSLLPIGSGIYSIPAILLISLIATPFIAWPVSRRMMLRPNS